MRDLGIKEMIIYGLAIYGGYSLITRSKLIKYHNQTGNINAPGLNEAFLSNIQFGMNRYGCEYLNRQFSQHQEKLENIPSNHFTQNSIASLSNRALYIEDLINNNCGPGKTDIASRPLFDGSVHPNLPVLN